MTFAIFTLNSNIFLYIIQELLNLQNKYVKMNHNITL